MKFLSIFLFCISLLFSQERYSQVEIPVQTIGEYRQLSSLGIAVDHFTGKIGSSISVFLNESELHLLQTSGIPYRVQIADWDLYYQKQQSQDISKQQVFANNVPKNFRYGAMGGFLTYQEVIQQLDSMQLLYPDLITVKDFVGTSIEGRTIYAVKISDNPDINETNEPEVLYTALHHAREPQGMMTLIYYMWWLLENYQSDPEAAYLIQHRQLWFIPVVNPDGYVHNQSTNPNGGGMWRKNRRKNSDDTYGVDLNRNYGPFFMWDAPNDGSSTITSAQDYRGTHPFSEPEIYTLQQFLTTHTIKACFNYHSYGNYLIYPWGYSSSESSDSLLFRTWTYHMSMINRYSIGTDQQTVGYSTRGNSDDFMYSDSAKSRTYSLTPEVGTTGFFWPATSLIYPLAQENVLQNNLLAHYAGAYPSIRSFSVNINTITVRIVNNGLEELQDTKIQLTANTGIVTPFIQTGIIPSMGEKELQFSYNALSVDGPTSIASKITFTIASGGMMNDSITFISGEPKVLLYDSAQSTSLWSTDSRWNVTNDLLTGNSCFTDSPAGNYEPFADRSLTLLSPLSLLEYQFAELKFRTQWKIESTWDFAVIEVSTNGGTSWTSLKTKLSRNGSGRTSDGSPSKQPVNVFGYDAYTPGLSWVEQSADLTPFVGNEIILRFRLSSDGWRESDGWYLDDIRVMAYSSITNDVPKTSVPYSYFLAQNFPNPFNPETMIEFSVAHQGRTALRVYNLLGQELSTILDQNMAPGRYSIKFDAKQLSSGVYFYRFTSGNHSDIKKMTVIK